MPIPAPGQSLSVMLDGAAGPIEALIQAPSGPVRGAAIVCHPHPLYGGAMSNKLTYVLARCAARAGLVSLRFNFRGVGKSAGVHDNGIGERDDAVRLAGALRERVPGALLVAGFSFGGDVAIAASEQLEPDALVTIAPPLKYLDVAPDWPGPDCPWQLLHSHDDEVVPFERTMSGLSRFSRRPVVVEFDGAGHFFHARLSAVRDAVSPFLEQALDRR